MSGVAPSAPLSPSFSAIGVQRPLSSLAYSREAKISSSPATIVDLSPDAKFSLNVDRLLESAGQAIFRAALSPLRPQLENLTLQRLQPDLTRAQAEDISEKINTREYLAFGRFASTSTLDFALGYLAYYDSLSPEEQNSQPYKGTREQVAGIARRAAAEEGRVIRDPDKAQDPLLLLFENLEEASFKLPDQSVEAFIERFRHEAGELPNAAADSAFVETAIARLRDIETLLGAARTGDAEALGRLEALAAGPDGLAAAVSYAATLRAGPPTVA